jgi:hypothetical protein
MTLAEKLKQVVLGPVPTDKPVDPLTRIDQFFWKLAENLGLPLSDSWTWAYHGILCIGGVAVLRLAAQAIGWTGVAAVGMALFFHYREKRTTGIKKLDDMMDVAIPWAVSVVIVVWNLAR